MFDLREYIAATPDFPKPGVLFRDIQPLLASPVAFARVMDAFADAWAGKVDVVVGLDARGFLFAMPLAASLGVPMVMVRKVGKLPGATIQSAYTLEYGASIVEMSAAALSPGVRVLVLDDLLATGGTAKAACSLVERQGALVVGCAFVIELAGLKGRELLAGYNLQTLVTYE